MSLCTNAKLESFSLEHYTYINQIFGDQTVREIISEVFPNKKLSFEIEDTGEDFEFSQHHVLRDKTTGIKICSVDDGYQNHFINKNDTLCQSYSLLTYFNIPISSNQKQRQMDMIRMYRTILSNKTIITKLDEIIYPTNNELWIDYTKNTNPYIIMNKAIILEKINIVLQNWEDYGYWYFIGNGKCPPIRNSSNIQPIVPSNISSRTRSSNRGGNNLRKKKLSKNKTINNKKINNKKINNKKIKNKQ